MKPITTDIPFFPRYELECKGSRQKDESDIGIPGTGIIVLDPRFAEALPKLRIAWNKPLTPNSVCRTPAHNAAERGHPRSLHLTENPTHPTFGTMAADIRWRGWRSDDQLAFAKLAYSMGWAVGLHDGFCHIDRRKDIGLPQIVFLYGTWTGAFSAKQVTA